MALKTFNTLIRLQKRRIDVLRREMIAIEEQKRQLTELSARLRKEHLREMDMAAHEPKMAGFFGAYSKRMKERQEKIADEVKRLDAAIAEKAEAIREEFSGQKRYEIAREHANKKLAEKARASLQARFDEIGTQQYIKLKDNPV